MSPVSDRRPGRPGAAPPRCRAVSRPYCCCCSRHEHYRSFRGCCIREGDRNQPQHTTQKHKETQTLGLRLRGQTGHPPATDQATACFIARLKSYLCARCYVCARVTPFPMLDGNKVLADGIEKSNGGLLHKSTTQVSFDALYLCTHIYLFIK